MVLPDVLHRSIDPDPGMRDLGAMTAMNCEPSAPSGLVVLTPAGEVESRASLAFGAAHDEVIDRLTRVAECRDCETHDHSQRLGRAASRIARAMGLDSRFADLLEVAAPLHDIGKVGIPDAILLKPGRLTPDERDEMQQHTIIGARILSGGTTDAVRAAELIALSHHERWDGGGYPHGLVADETAIGARITAIVDVFDALTHERPYKEAWPICEAVAHVVAGSGTHFDPAVVAAFRTVDPVDLLGHRPTPHRQYG